MRDRRLSDLGCRGAPCLYEAMCMTEEDLKLARGLIRRVDGAVLNASHDRDCDVRAIAHLVRSGPLTALNEVIAGASPNALALKLLTVNPRALNVERSHSVTHSVRKLHLQTGLAAP